MVALNLVAESIDKNSDGRLFQSVAVLGQKLYTYKCHSMSAAKLINYSG